MAFTCEFSSAFSSAFAICPTETPTGETPTLRGVPSAIPRPRKRPDVQEISGSGLIPVIGAGDLTGEACLISTLDIATEGSGRLTREAFTILVGEVRQGAESVLTSEKALGAFAYIEPATRAVVALDVMMSGEGGVGQSFSGYLWRERAVGGLGAIRAGGEARLMAEESEEALILMAAEVLRRLTA